MRGVREGGVIIPSPIENRNSGIDDNMVADLEQFERLVPIPMEYPGQNSAKRMPPSTALHMIRATAPRNAAAAGPL